MIPYAGQDVLESAPTHGSQSYKFRAYALFTELGWSTDRIARLLKVPEAQVVKYLDSVRSKS